MKLVTKFKDEEEKKTHVVLKPTVCFFCSELIVKLGKDSDSLCVHSLDENHDNWAPENKVPSHISCHTRFHKTGKHHTEKTKKKISLAKLGEKNAMFGRTGKKNPMFGRTGEKHPNFGKHPTEASKKKMRISGKKHWNNMTLEQRKERGRKMSEGHRKAKEKRNHNVSDVRLGVQAQLEGGIKFGI